MCTWSKTPISPSFSTTRPFPWKRQWIPLKTTSHDLKPMPKRPYWNNRTDRKQRSFLFHNLSQRHHSGPIHRKDSAKPVMVLVLGFPIRKPGLHVIQKPKMTSSPMWWGWWDSRDGSEKERLKNRSFLDEIKKCGIPYRNKVEEINEF